MLRSVYFPTICVSLFMCFIIVLGGCASGPAADSSGIPQKNVPEKQAEVIQPVVPDAEKTAPAATPKAERVKAQILFLRMDRPEGSVGPLPVGIDPAEIVRNIWIMDEGGGNAINITKNTANVICADWSPDKSKIVCDSVNGSTYGFPTCALYVMNADGSDMKKISPGGQSRHYPDWSPDGSKIVNCGYFTAQCPHPSSTPCKFFALYSSAQDGSVDQLLKLSPERPYDVLPRWLPDGKRIAFLRNESGYFGVYSGDINSGDSAKYNIESNLTYMPWFSLSTDATRIAFSHDFSKDYYHKGREIFVFDIGTGESLRLTNNDYCDDYPCFSPDGKQVLFASSGDTEATWGMFVIDIDGKNLKKIPSKYGDLPMKWK